MKWKNINTFDETGAEKQSYWNPGSSVQLNPIWALNRVLYYQKRERFLGLDFREIQFQQLVEFAGPWKLG